MVIRRDYVFNNFRLNLNYPVNVNVNVNITKHTQEEIENMYIFVSVLKMEFIFKASQKNTTGPDGVSVRFYQIFKEVIILFLCELFLERNTSLFFFLVVV